MSMPPLPGVSGATPPQVITILAPPLRSPAEKREGEKNPSKFPSNLPRISSPPHLLITTGIPNIFVCGSFILPRKILQISEIHRLNFPAGFPTRSVAGQQGLGLRGREEEGLCDSLWIRDKTRKRAVLAFFKSKQKCVLSDTIRGTSLPP